MGLYKKYLPVIALIDETGELHPMYIVWEEDGIKKTYHIDKVLAKRYAFSQVGGCGLLYECLILNKRRRLFYERDKWFIECLDRQ